MTESSPLRRFFALCVYGPQALGQTVKGISECAVMQNFGLMGRIRVNACLNGTGNLLHSSLQVWPHL